MLTQIPRISRNFSFDDVKSHGGFGCGRVAHTDPTNIGAMLTQIPQISRNFFLMMLNLTEVSGVGVWLTQIPLACFMAHTDPTDLTDLTEFFF